VRNCQLVFDSAQKQFIWLRFFDLNEFVKLAALTMYSAKGHDKNTVSFCVSGKQ
jgi:hypothetical protein